MKLGIFGYGKMGKMLEAIAHEFTQISSIKVYSRNEDISQFIGEIDFLIDFSNSQGAEFLIETLLTSKKLPKAFVSGSTGLSEDIKNKLSELSNKLPIMHEANFSLCTHLQAYMAEKMVLALGDKYDIDIIDVHHKHKLDSPSGTSYMLADSINQSLETAGLDKHKIVTDRFSNPVRGPNEIAISSIRTGNVVGKHEVMFQGEYDSISITHNVEKREVFAIGAIKSGLWLTGKPNGVHKFRDMLGLS